MKKLTIALALTALAGVAQAGEYHRLGQLRCSDCHTMHASRQHNFNSASAAPAFPQGTATITPNDYLLIAGTANETCLECHDGRTFAPDVLGATNTFAATAGARSAGFLNEAGDGAAIEMNGHTLDGTAVPPGFSGSFVWGTGGTTALECASCHAVHGSRAYRNAGLGRAGAVNGFPTSGAGSFSAIGATYNFKASVATADPTVDVTILSGVDGVANDVLMGTAGVTNSYKTDEIIFGQGSGNATNAIFTGTAVTGASVKVLAPNGMNTYCAGCHGNFHGTANVDNLAGTANIRHPTSGVVRTDTTFTGAFTGIQGTDPYGAQFDNAQGTLVRAVFTATNKSAFEVGCLTCHKAHGNGRPFALVFPDHTGTAVDLENGDAAALADGTYPIRNLCVTCHGMGKTY
jgi:hypothetical protein